MLLTSVGLRLPADEQACAIFGGAEKALAQALGEPASALSRAGDLSQAIAPAPTWGE